MKKFFIFLSIVIVSLAILPLIGNKLINETLDSKLLHLEKNGIEVKSKIVESSYLTTKRHYEFLVQDVEKFLDYISKYSDEQLPSYVDGLIDGVVVGSDLEYSNLFFAEDMSIDIYPLNVSKEIQASLEAEDRELYIYIEKFLKNRGFLYHLNYNIASEDFNGYIKDIDENYTLKDSTRVVFKLLNAIYHGNGQLIAPNSLISSIETIILDIENQNDNIELKMKNFHSSSNFESHTTYVTTASLKSFDLNAVTPENNVSINGTNLYANISSNTQGKKAQLYTKSSAEQFSIQSNELTLKALDLNYDTSFNDMDKDAFEALRVNMSKIKHGSSQDLQELLENSLISLVSNGLVFNVADLSAKKIMMDKKDLGGFSLISRLKVTEDKNLAGKVAFTPLFILQNIELDLRVKLSKILFEKVTDPLPMVKMIKSYAKEEMGNLIYDISYNKQEFRVNGKVL